LIFSDAVKGARHDKKLACVKPRTPIHMMRLRVPAAYHVVELVWKELADETDEVIDLECSFDTILLQSGAK
jgi:hypothetical protein